MSSIEVAMKYDNLRLCNDYIADMEGQLDAIAQAVGVKRGKPEELLAAIQSFSDVNAELEEVTRSYKTARNLAVERGEYAGLQNRALGSLKEMLAKQLVGLPDNEGGGVLCCVCGTRGTTEDRHTDDCPVPRGLAIIEAANG